MPVAARTAEIKAYVAPDARTGAAEVHAHWGMGPSDAINAFWQSLSTWAACPSTCVSRRSRAATGFGAARRSSVGNERPARRNDLLIAATALAHGVTLVSNSAREFRRVEGLLLETWTEADF